MKLLLSACAVAMLLGSTGAFALPVLNANTPGAENVTIFPDHLDKNLFYLAPTVFVVSKDEAGAPNFSYLEYYNRSGSRRALVQTTLRPDFSYESIARAKATITAYNPQARFTALAFEDSRVNFSDELKDVLVSSDCRHTAGTVADEQACAFRLSSRGIKVFVTMLKRGLTITTQFKYTINGVRQNADASYANYQNTYQVTGRIGGTELAKYPDLFRGVDGRTIPDERFSPRR